MSAIGTIPAIGTKLACIELTDPVLVPVVEAANVPLTNEPKRASLPSMLPAACMTSRREERVPSELDERGDADGDDEDRHHRREEDPSLARDPRRGAHRCSSGQTG